MTFKVDTLKSHCGVTTRGEFLLSHPTIRLERDAQT